MGFGYGIWLLILGALAVPNLILAKKPELKPTLDKLTPYQGWIGVVSAFWGIYGLVFGSLLGISLLSSHAIWWIVYTACSATTLGLGLLLGVGTMKTFIKDPAQQAQLDARVAKLAPYQGTLGIAALVLSIVCIVVTIVF